MTNHDTNYDTYRLSNVIIRYFTGDLGEGSPDLTGKEPDKEFQPIGEKDKKKRCLLFDYRKKNQSPVINVVKIFGLSDKEEDVFEFEIDKEGNYEEDGDNIILRRQVNAFDKYYVVEIECTKGERLY